MQTASRIFHNAPKMIRHILKCFRVLQYYQWCYKISSKSLIIYNWFKLSSSWGQLKVRKFLPFHPVSPHLSGSSLWGRQSLVEMLCLQAAGWRPQQSHCIYHWMSLDVSGHWWSLPALVQNPWSAVSCWCHLMPNPSGTRTTLAVKPSTQAIASVVYRHQRAWDDKISKHFQSVLFMLVPDQLETIIIDPILLRWLIWLVRCWCKWMLMCHGPWERQHSGYRVPAGPSFQPVPHRIPNESTNFDKPLMILASFTVSIHVSNRLNMIQYVSSVSFSFIISDAT